MTDHYNKIEEILQYISRNFITLRRADCREINIILNHVIQSIIDQMSKLNTLFHYLYNEPFFGGSYYCGLKIKRPDEFDIDLKLQIPEIVNPILYPEDDSGFVRIKLQDIDKLQGDYNLIRELKKLLDDDNYIVQNKTVEWIYGLVCKSLNNIISGCVITPYYNGPAVRLNISYYGGSFDVDFVVSFEFAEKYWPCHPFKSGEKYDKKTFLVVPKKPKHCDDFRLFRYSFQEQENEIISGKYYGKPVFRLIKKLRDTQKHQTSSYVLKTMFLWEIEERNENYWSQPMNVIFFDMLETYKKYMSDHNVPYFWNRNENLLDNMNQETSENIANFLERMINTVDSYINKDIYIFAKFLLNENEYRQLINYFRGTRCECSRDDDRLYQEIRTKIHS